MISVQMESFPLAGLLSSVKFFGLAKLSHNLTKPHFENLSKPDARLAARLSAWLSKAVNIPRNQGAILTEIATNIDMSGQFSISCNDRGRSFATSMRSGIVQGDEAGGAPGAARLTQQVDQSSAASDFNLRRWRRLISPLAAAIKKPAVLSPSSLIFSISSKSSRGSLTETCSERLFFLPVAITGAPVFRWCSVYTGKKIAKALRWCSPCYTLVVFTLSTGKEQVTHRTAKPGSALTLTGPLTTSVIISNEVAMSDHITPNSGRDSLTPKKYQYRFLALSRADAAARPCSVSIEAITEHEARRVLAPLFILSLAARLPAQEAHHA